MGAERAASKDSAVPAWDGGLTKPPAGWSGTGLCRSLSRRQAQATITAQNVEQYKDKLSPGLVESSKVSELQNAGVRRAPHGGYPADVYDKVKEQATKAELDGYSVKDLGGSTVPFPIPKNGQEAIQNHMVRYLGGGFERHYHWFPVRANGDSYKVGFREYRVWDQNFDQHVDNRLFSFLGFFTNPPTLEGTIYLAHEPIDQVKESRQAWIYNAGQRRRPR